MDREQTAPPALSDAIERLMANPELISMVASALGAPRSGAGESKPTPEPETAREISESVSLSSEPVSTEKMKGITDELPVLLNTLAPLLSAKGGGDKRGALDVKDDRGACLLRALKPYVSGGRREAIDYMIRISQISELLRHL